eukprot:6275608-Prymnesium_polylepis.1
MHDGTGCSAHAACRAMFERHVAPSWVVAAVQSHAHAHACDATSGPSCALGRPHIVLYGTTFASLGLRAAFFLPPNGPQATRALPHRLPSALDFVGLDAQPQTWSRALGGGPGLLQFRVFDHART